MDNTDSFINRVVRVLAGTVKVIAASIVIVPILVIGIAFLGSERRAPATDRPESVRAAADSGAAQEPSAVEPAQPEVPQLAIRAEEYGDESPYPGKRGATLGCQMVTAITGKDVQAVTIRFDGLPTLYGLNGTAQTYLHLPDSRAHVATDPEYGTYILGAIHEIIQLGQRLCRE